MPKSDYKSGLSNGGIATEFTSSPKVNAAAEQTGAFITIAFQPEQTLPHLVT